MHLKGLILGLCVLCTILLVYTEGKAATIVDNISMPNNAIPGRVTQHGSKLYVGYDGLNSTMGCYDLLSNQWLWNREINTTYANHIVPMKNIVVNNGNNILIYSNESMELLLLDSVNGNVLYQLFCGEYPTLLFESILGSNHVIGVVYSDRCEYLNAPTLTNLLTIDYSGYNNLLKAYFSKAQNKLYLPFFQDGIVIEHSLAWNSNLSIGQRDITVNFSPITCFLSANNVISIVGENIIENIDGVTLTSISTGACITHPVDVREINNSLVVLSCKDTMDDLAAVGGIVVNASNHYTYSDRFLFSICEISDGFDNLYLINNGEFTGCGNTSPGSLLKINLNSGSIVEELVLVGNAGDYAYDDNLSRIYICDQGASSIVEIQLP